MYRSLTELTLSRWIDFTVDGYLQALVKEGTPPQCELLACAADLRIQYADAIGDHEYRMYCAVMAEITRLEITLTEIENLLEVLREAYHPLFADNLNRLLGSSLAFNVYDSESYDNDLKRAFRRSRGIKMRLDLKHIELQKLEIKYNGGDADKQRTPGKADREYYMGMLITLSDDAGYELTDSITVWNFCERIKRANKKAELKLKSHVAGRNR